MDSGRLPGKVRRLDELAVLVGPRPRARKVVMAHGTFDLVHPGHIRHLRYAKSKGDILIASVTADRHVDKGHYRPHVPQELRAMNLAALEMVDYVLVDPNATPLETISALQPDYFAKGYEYRDFAVPGTELEAAAVEAYGGQILFTPGDVVYSSSRLLEAVPPRLGHDKLLSVMARDGLTFDALRRAVSEMAGSRVHVVGDMIVDSYTHTAVLGGQSKTPTLSVLHERTEDFVGGAGVVAKHIRAAGAAVTLSTVIGPDDAGRFALADVARTGVRCLFEIDDTRPTTRKHAFVCGGYRLLKVDTVDNRTISDSVAGALRSNIEGTPADAVVFSDFRHGIFNRRTIPALVDAIRAPFRAADSQVASRWGNITDFLGFDLITPNEREARFALGDQDSGIRPLASVLYGAAKCRTLILKLGERGLVACRGDDGEALNEFVALDSFAGPVVDAVGAGDALLAYSTLAMLVTGNAAAAAILGGIAAGLECERDGNVPIRPEAMLARIDAIERGATYKINVNFAGGPPVDPQAVVDALVPVIKGVAKT